MEWLIAHEDDLNVSTSKSENLTKIAKVEPETGNKSAMSSAPKDGSPKDSSSNETAANMAARKKITLDEAQRIITERQSRRAEEERKKEIEDEKRRRIDGQKMAETRAELQDQERIRLAQQIRREKLEKELHRKQVLDQIARDREAMQSKSIHRSNTSNNSTQPSPATSTSNSTPKTLPKPNECRLALRFPDGSSKIQKFSPGEQLSAVRLFVKMEKGGCDNIEFVEPPNRKLTEDNMNETLEGLGLCPASRLEVKYMSVHWESD